MNIGPHIEAVSRREMIQKARQMRVEIEQLFLDTDHWNRNVRKASESEIDPDPDGRLKKLGASIDAMLAAENRRAQS